MILCGNRELKFNLHSEKHLLEDELELPVLEFLEMMLG